MITHKRCNGCGLTKPLDMFEARRNRCKACVNARRRLRYAQDPAARERRQEYNKRYNQSPRGRARRREYQKLNNQTEHRKAYMRAYMADYYRTGRHKADKRAYDAAYRAKRRDDNGTVGKYPEREPIDVF